MTWAFREIGLVPHAAPALIDKEKILERAGILMTEGGAREHFRSLLDEAGIDTVAFEHVAALLRHWRRDVCRLLFIDIDLPDEDWPVLLSQIHGQSLQRAVIIGIGASAQSACIAFDAGVDEFIALPCRPMELVARVQVALRRADPVRPDTVALRCGPCALDIEARRLVAPRGFVELTSRETAVARCLFQSPGRLVSWHRLARIWEVEADIAGRSIEQHVYQLRRKLKRCVGDAVVLRSVYARGYRLECMAAVRAD